LFVVGAFGSQVDSVEAQNYELQRERCGVDATHRTPPDPDAISDCTAVIRSGKETPQAIARAYVNRGDAYRLRERDIDRALDDYSQAIRLQPDFALAFTSRGFTYLFEKRDPNRAIDDLNQAIRLDPAFANAFYYRGTAYFDKGEFERAIADYDQAIRLRPDFSNAYRDRGEAKLARGDRAGGNADLAEAERIGSREPACGGRAGCKQ
jgi:tetratricopeptide (TPR) repeat protein